MNNPNFFKPVLLAFAVFMFLQFLTGFLLYALKIGLHPAETLEYYVGSIAMRSVYPERPDRFIQPRTFRGLVKSSLAHFAAYGVICFVLVHLLNFLRKVSSSSPPYIDWLAPLLFLCALLDVLGGFAVRYGPHWMSYFRIIVFLLFTATGITLVVYIYLIAHGDKKFEINQFLH